MRDRFQRSLIAAMALLMMPALAAAQGATCRTSAQMRLDQCASQWDDDPSAQRRCMDRYRNAVSRCRSIPDDPLDPPAPIGRVDPLNPPLEQSRPIRPQFKSIPRTPTYQRPTTPVVPYPRQTGPVVKRP